MTLNSRYVPCLVGRTASTLSRVGLVGRPSFLFSSFSFFFLRALIRSGPCLSFCLLRKKQTTLLDLGKSSLESLTLFSLAPICVLR